MLGDRAPGRAFSHTLRGRFRHRPRASQPRPLRPDHDGGLHGSRRRGAPLRLQPESGPGDARGIAREWLALARARARGAAEDEGSRGTIPPARRAHARAPPPVAMGECHIGAGLAPPPACLSAARPDGAVHARQRIGLAGAGAASGGHGGADRAHRSRRAGASGPGRAVSGVALRQSSARVPVPLRGRGPPRGLPRPPGLSAGSASGRQRRGLGSRYARDPRRAAAPRARVGRLHRAERVDGDAARNDPRAPCQGELRARAGRPSHPRGNQPARPGVRPPRARRRSRARWPPASRRLNWDMRMLYSMAG